MDKIKAFIRVNRLDSSCSIGVILFCLISVAFVYWLNHGALYTGLDLEEPGNVARIFSIALKVNDSRKVHSIVVREKWPEIDEWVDNHRKVNCDLDFDGENGGVYYSEDFTNDRQAQYDAYIAYYCTHVSYSLAVRDVELEYIDGEWKIVDWGDICESTNRENSCEDFFY